jgi:hypothetical protein
MSQRNRKRGFQFDLNEKKLTNYVPKIDDFCHFLFGESKRIPCRVSVNSRLVKPFAAIEEIED